MVPDKSTSKSQVNSPLFQCLDNVTTLILVSCTAQTHGSYGGFREHCPGKVQGSYVFAPSHACACASPSSWELWRFSRTLPWQGPRCCYVFAPSHACACASPNSWEFGCFFVTKFTFTSTMRNPNRDGGMSPGKRPGPIGPPGALH